MGRRRAAMESLGVSAARTRQLLLPLGISAAGIGWVLYQIEPSAIADAFAQWNIAGVALALAGLGLGYGARICRWRLMLLRLAVAPPLGQTAAIYLGSIALNNVLPLRAGDVARVAWLARSRNIGITRGAVSVVLERALDAAALGAILLLAWPVGTPPPEFTLAVLLIACLAALVAPWWFPVARRIGTATIKWMPLPAVQSSWERFAGLLEEALAAFRKPGLAMLLVTLTGLGWCGEA